MPEFLTRPGILTFSLVFDIAWIVGLVGGVVNARFQRPVMSRGRLWVLLPCSLYGVAFQTWYVRTPTDAVMQHWVVFLLGLCGTTFLLGLSLGTLLGRWDTPRGTQ